MSVTTSQSRISYKGDGASVVFPFPYLFQNNADIEVWVNNVQLTTGFTTTGASNASLPTVGGQVAFTVPPAIGSTITLFRNPTTLQKTVIAANDPFPAKTVETALDAAMLAVQRLFDIMALEPGQNQLPVALSYPFQEQNLSGTLPPAATRALSALTFDVNGLPTVAPLPASIGAGNLTPEGPFVNGVNFTSGTTTSLTLSQAYGSAANVRVQFDGTLQGFDQYNLVGNQINFLTPIIANKVYIVGGTTLSIFAPALNTVGDGQINWGNILKRVCTTVAAVAALNPLFYQEAFATGFAAQGDGGGGDYYYSSTSTATVDNATVLPSLSGSGRWLLNIVGRLSAGQCGAIGDGVTDNTAAMTVAHATGRVIHYGVGNFVYSALTIPAGGIVGEGPSNTILTSSDTSAGDTITLTAANEVPTAGAYLFRDFSLDANAGKSSGSGINVNPAAGENQGSLLDNVWFFLQPTCLTFSRASLWTVTGCKFVQYKTCGVYVNNNNVADSGDSSITGGNLFNTSFAGAVAVFQGSSGGLKINNFKMNGGAYGYLLDINNNGSTSDLMISNGSIENMDSAAVQFSRSTGSSQFSHVVIDALQIAICANGILSDASNSLSDVAIGSGVTISLRPGSGSAVNFASGNNISVAPIQITGNGGSPTGLAFAAACTNGKYANPVTFGIPAPVSNSSTSVFQSDGLQVGSSSVGTSTPYGTLYSGSVNITFPTPYKNTPAVKCGPSSGTGGGISGFPSAITTAGFTLNIIGATNGGSVTAQWNATGDI